MVRGIVKVHTPDLGQNIQPPLVGGVVKTSPKQQPTASTLPPLPRVARQIRPMEAGFSQELSCLKSFMPSSQMSKANLRTFNVTLIASQSPFCEVKAKEANFHWPKIGQNAQNLPSPFILLLLLVLLLVLLLPLNCDMMKRSVRSPLHASQAP